MFVPPTPIYTPGLEINFSLEKPFIDVSFKQE
jgi:hypothetical protein